MAFEILLFLSKKGLDLSRSVKISFLITVLCFIKGGELYSACSNDFLSSINDQIALDEHLSWKNHTGLQKSISSVGLKIEQIVEATHEYQAAFKTRDLLKVVGSFQHTAELVKGYHYQKQIAKDFLRVEKNFIFLVDALSSDTTERLTRYVALDLLADKDILEIWRNHPAYKKVVDRVALLRFPFLDGSEAMPYPYFTHEVLLYWRIFSSQVSQGEIQNQLKHFKRDLENNVSLEGSPKNKAVLEMEWMSMVATCSSTKYSPSFLIPMLNEIDAKNGTGVGLLAAVQLHAAVSCKLFHPQSIQDGFLDDWLDIGANPDQLLRGRAIHWSISNSLDARSPLDLYQGSFLVSSATMLMRYYLSSYGKMNPDSLGIDVFKMDDAEIINSLPLVLAMVESCIALDFTEDHSLSGRNFFNEMMLYRDVIKKLLGEVAYAPWAGHPTVQQSIFYLEIYLKILEGRFQ